MLNRFKGNHRDFAIENGESWKDVNARALDFICNDIIMGYLLNPEYNQI